MHKIETDFLENCLLTLEEALKLLNDSQEGTISYNLYRSACIKEFEIILEQAGKLLKKALKPYFLIPKETDRLFYKDIFRYAAKHGILNIDEVERWLEYRDNRNTTAHDYGEGFAEETLKMLPQFISDSKSLITAIHKQNESQT